MNIYRPLCELLSTIVLVLHLHSLTLYAPAIPSPSRLTILTSAANSSEHVCTKNLTLFLKLLPCESHAGLAELLNPQHIFNMDWHGLGVHMHSTEARVELSLGVQAILDPVRQSGGRQWGKMQQSPLV